MVRLTATLRPRTHRCGQDILDALRFLAVGTRLEPGCLDCSVTSGDEVLRYVEEWAGEPEMRQRVRSERFTALLTVLEEVEDPELRFEFVGGTRGLDYVEEIRAATDQERTREPRDQAPNRSY
jgi:quinol monooxygenase YgiN